MVAAPSLFRAVVRDWLPLAIVATIFIGFVAIVAQQNLRLSLAEWKSGVIAAGSGWSRRTAQ